MPATAHAAEHAVGDGDGGGSSTTSGDAADAPPTAPAPAPRVAYSSWAAAANAAKGEDDEADDPSNAQFRAVAPEVMRAARVAREAKQRAAVVVGHSSNLIARKGPAPRPQDEDESVELCTYYARGNCMYGSRCFYRHADPLAVAAAQSARGVSGGSASHSSGSSERVAGSAPAAEPSVGVTTATQASAATAVLAADIAALVLDGDSAAPTHAQTDAGAAAAATMGGDTTWAAGTLDVGAWAPPSSSAASAASAAAQGADAWGAPSGAGDAGDTEWPSIGTSAAAASASTRSPVVSSDTAGTVPAATASGGGAAWGASDLRSEADAALAAVQADEEREAALSAREEQLSAEAECAICFENPPRRQEWFGILTGCSHSFCLTCIRAWRGRTDLPPDTVRACPACRVNSHFIVPSAVVVEDPTRKAILVEGYKQKQRAIPCRHFNYGRGKCPFGSSCFYAHVLPDGTPADQEAPRLRMAGDGSARAIGGVKLSDFL